MSAAGPRPVPMCFTGVQMEDSNQIEIWGEREWQWVETSAYQVVEIPLFIFKIFIAMLHLCPRCALTMSKFKYFFAGHHTDTSAAVSVHDLLRFLPYLCLLGMCMHECIYIYACVRVQKFFAYLFLIYLFWCACQSWMCA